MSFSIYDFQETLKGESIERTDIKKIIEAYGVTEPACCDDCGGEWAGGFLLHMKSGKYIFVTGWCDYTGWGCQDGTQKTEFDTKPKLKDLSNGYGSTKEWETVLPDLNHWVRTGV
jgi:hypothetical protein